MEEVLKLAKKAGMSEEQGKAAMGGFVGLLKQHVPAEQYAQLEAKIPGLKEAQATYGQQVEQAKSGQGEGGMMGAVLANTTGGKDTDGDGKVDAPSNMASLLTALTSMGIDPGMIQKFLPQITTFIQEKCGVDISQYVKVPGVAPAAPAAGGEGAAPAPAAAGGDAADTASKLMGQAMGMFGKK